MVEIIEFHTNFDDMGRKPVMSMCDIYTHVFWTHTPSSLCLLCVPAEWPSSSVWPSVPQWVCSQLRVTGWRNWSRLKVTLPLSQSQAGVDTHGHSAHPFIWRDLRVERTTDWMGPTVHTVIRRPGQKRVCVYSIYTSPLPAWFLKWLIT